MQRHTLSVLILALAVAMPARAHHATHPADKVKSAKPVAVVAIPLGKPLASSKGSRLVASAILPGGKPAPKVAAKPTKLAPAVCIASTASVALPVTGPVLLQGRLARITAYYTQEDPDTAKHMSSTGVHLHEGHCAVDPKLIPYGSLVQIPGMGSYVAVDTGSAVISRQAAVGSGQTAAQRNALVVDLFFENRREAEDFAAHGPAFAAVSWSKPVAAIDSPNNPRALPAIPTLPPGVYVLAQAPSMADMRMPLAFRAPQL